MEEEAMNKAILLIVISLLFSGCQKIYMGSSGAIPRSARPFAARYERITFYQKSEGDLVMLYCHSEVRCQLQYGDSITIELPVGRNSIGLQTYRDGHYQHGLLVMEVPFNPINPQVNIDHRFLKDHCGNRGEWDGW